MTDSNSNDHSHHHHHHDDHDHDHDEHGHSHENESPPGDLLYQQIDFDRIETLNEVQPQSGQSILKKTWQERLETEPELESDADEQLLMHVPFTGQVNLSSIMIRTSETLSAPKTLKVFVNKENIDFEAAMELAPTQTFEMAQTNQLQEIPVRRALFNAVQHITLFFEDNFGQEGEEEETTRMSYIGLRGTFLRLNREPISFLYEIAANPTDQKVSGNAPLSTASRLAGGHGPG